MFGSRRRILDIAAVAIFVTVLAVLFWPSGGDGDDADPAPDDVSEEQVTPTPDATPAEDALTPEETEVASCETGDSARILARFVERFNEGDLEGLRALLPDTGVQNASTAVFPGMDRGSLHSFRVHESGGMSDPDAVLSYLEQRRDAGEVWQLQDYTITRLTNYANPDTPELDRAEAVIRRSAGNLPRHEVEGRAVIDCRAGSILVWDFETDNLDLALPVTVETFLDAVGPYGTAEMRDLRILVSSELRADGGSLQEWEIRRIDANNAAGAYVMAFEVLADGERIVDFIYDGTRWFLEQRDWQESGSITGPGVLPLEHTLVNQEPTETANLIREQLEDRSVSELALITDEFEVEEGLRNAVSQVHDVDEVRGRIEIEIEDGNLIRTRYLVVDPESDLSVTVAEIQWIHLKRRQQFEPGRFMRPDDFRPDDRQYQPPDALADSMTFQDTIEHDEGIGERYELDWNGETVELTIRPSRGASDQRTFGESWPTSWAVDRTVVRDWTVVSAGPAGDDTFPHAAVWDTGSHRFELSVDPGSLNDVAAWDAEQVRAIAEALTSDDS